MTLFPGTGVTDPYLDALRVVAAAGDRARGVPAGTSERAAARAASLSRALDRPVEEVHAVVVASLFAGAAAFVPAARYSGRILGAVRLAREAGLVPFEAADAIRWHRECWDGSGIPDALHWEATPQTAAITGAALAFAEAEGEDGRDRTDAAYALFAKSGRELAPQLALALHHDALDEAPTALDDLPPLPSDNPEDAHDRVLAVFAGAIDDARGRGAGRNGRLVHRVRQQIASGDVDPALGAEAVALARLRVLCEVFEPGDAASILGSIPRYATIAPLVRDLGDDANDDPRIRLVRASLHET